MRRTILKKQTKEITRGLKESYELILENNKYSIKCTEYCSTTKETSYEEVNGFTDNRQRAEEIFKLLVENDVCVGTVEDIIMEQMC